MIDGVGSRGLVLVAAALVTGASIAYVDSRPGWDDTGITVGLLVLAAGAVAVVSSRRPWLWAVLVGASAPAVEIAAGGSVASLAALAFAAFGAFGGWLLRRSLGPEQRPGVPPR
jgi:hypothetical protein